MNKRLANSGRISKNLKPQTQIDKIIDFMESALPDWRDDANRPLEKSENKLNLQLCKFLDSQARQKLPMFQFKTEEPQGGHRAADLSASPLEETQIDAIPYTMYTPILIIECKRLPAPARTREIEYVTTGTTKTKGGKYLVGGGIQRFKHGKYAKSHERAVMIGYIQEKDWVYWKKQINQWIAGLVQEPKLDICRWQTTDKLDYLNNDAVARVAKLESNHNRTKTNPIKLTHIWIEMHKQNS